MQREIIRRRQLPHWDVADATYFVTACLQGSIPARGLLDLDNYRAELARRNSPDDRTKQESQRDKWKLEFARADRWLDHEPANRALEDERLARIVVDSMFHFAAVRYDLLALVVMPSHIHWLFQPTQAWVATFDQPIPTPRQRIMKSLKTWTGGRCNELLGLRGAFWQQESYDHWVRDIQELERIILYIEANPVAAGLVDSPEKWFFSSAAVRHRLGLDFGCPLLREHWQAYVG